MILLADLLNGILIEIGNLIQEEQATCEEQRNMWVWVGFFLPLAIYLFIGVISILNDYIMCTCNRPCIQTTHTRKCLCPPGFECNKTFIKLSTFCGSILYYIGDNLENVDCKENASTISLILSVAGLLLYRVHPVALKKLKRYYRNDEGEPLSHNLCSPNRNETHSLVIAYTFLLTIVIDFDVVFTAVLNKINESNIILCNETVQSDIFWGLFWSTIGFFVFIQLIITAIFFLTQCRHCISRWDCCERICNSLLSKVKLILSTRKPCCLILIIIWDIFLFFAVPVAVTFFLLADNEEILQCFTSIPEGEASQYRILFLLLSFGLCSLVMFGFLIRKWARCVQIKGKITQVTIEDGQQLTVQVQNEVGNQTYTFNYNTATKEITSDNCNHAELYRNDVERIIELPQNISTIEQVVINNNRITVRHQIREQNHQEVFTINEGRIENQNLPPAHPQSSADEEEEEEDKEDKEEGKKEDKGDVAGRARRLSESGSGASLVLKPDRLSPNSHRGHSSDIRRQRSYYSLTPMTVEPPLYSNERSTDRQRSHSRTSGPSLVSSLVRTSVTESEHATKPKSGGVNVRLRSLSHSPHTEYSLSNDTDDSEKETLLSSSKK